MYIVGKLPPMYHLKFSILAFSAIFCPTEIDLSGNTLWPPAPGFPKLAKLTILGIFYELLFTQKVYYTKLASLAMLNDTFPMIFQHRAIRLVNVTEGESFLIKTFPLVCSCVFRESGISSFPP